MHSTSIQAAALTLVLVPVLYRLVEGRRERKALLRDLQAQPEFEPAATIDGWPHLTYAAMTVVGQPDPYRGETVVAYVSVKAGRAVTGEELIEFTRQRMAAYKYPRIVHVIDDLPKTQTGKIRRRALRENSPKG